MKGRHDFLLYAVIAIATALITFAGTSAFYAARLSSLPMWAIEIADSEVAPLTRKYGTSHASEGHEEFLIRDFFQDRRDGVFLDVGANHYRVTSNTYFLETSLGWSGVAIEPQEQYAADYARFRPRTKFVAMFAGDTAGETVQLFVTPGSNLVASATPNFTERWGKATPTPVPTTTLNVVLQQAEISRLDFMSMDIELHEPQALAGFDIDRYRPELVCIESQPEVRQQILDYFQRHDYVIVGKYLRIDPSNLYFTPKTVEPRP